MQSGAGQLESFADESRSLLVDNGYAGVGGRSSMGPPL